MSSVADNLLQDTDHSENVQGERETNNGHSYTTFSMDPVKTKDGDTTRPQRRWCGRQYWIDTIVACLAEVIGTAIFLYVAVLTCVTGEPFAIAFGAGGTICLLIIAMADISGAHFNPAASLGFFLVGELPFIRLPLYTLSQAGGSVIGAYLARVVLSNSIVSIEGVGNITEFESISGGAHFLHGGISPVLAILAEAIFCFSMMIVVFLTAVDSKTKSPLAAIAIGFVIINNILAGLHNTSGSFNPVRSFGAAVAISYYRPDVWTDHYVYWAGPMVGSLVAAFTYRIFFSDREHSIRSSIIKLV